MGAGATAMPHIYQGFRLIMEDVLKCLADAQQQFGGPLRAKAIRAIMEEKRKAPIPGCPRTFTRGLVRVLAETGLGERVGRRFQLHLADWQRVMDINLNGPFYCCRSVVPHLLKNGYGRIVSIASIARRMPMSHTCHAMSGELIERTGG